MSRNDDALQAFALLDELLARYAGHLPGCPAASSMPACDCDYGDLQRRANAIRARVTGAACQHYSTDWRQTSKYSLVGIETCRLFGATRQISGDHDEPWTNPPTP